MEEETERRRHRRLSLRLEVFCRKVGSESRDLIKARAVNIGAGGVLLEADQLAPADDGDLFSLEFEAPPEDVNLEFGGRFSGFGRVVRAIERGGENEDSDLSSKKHVAMEFCGRPRLEF